MSPGSPRFTDAERAVLASFGAVLDEVRDEVDEAARSAAAEIPAFSAILERLDPAELERQSARSRELERQALIEGRWDEYLDHLRGQGATYAKLGVAFGDWYGLLSPYRDVILERVLSGEPHPDTRPVIEGMGRFLDVAMATLAESYMETKEALLGEKERQLQRYVRELERSNKELDDFAYVASHDLKAPLRDIQTLAEWVVDDSGEDLSDESRRHLGLLGERIGRMERLLEDLLQYSRAGRAIGEREDVDVRAAVDAAAKVVIPPAGFELSVSGDAPRITAPRAAFELLLRNLIGNAVKHHDRAEGRIAVHVLDRGDAVEVAVEDDGPGIPAEFHQRVFRMFQTLRPRDEIEGSGMGLAVVKKIVEKNDGTIALESTPGEGTTVRFTWPKGGGQ